MLETNNKWYLFNDSIITEVSSIKDVKKQNNRDYKQVLLAWYKIYRSVEESDDDNAPVA
jgi:hypothetical protein